MVGDSFLKGKAGGGRLVPQEEGRWWVTHSSRGRQVVGDSFLKRKAGGGQAVCSFIQGSLTRGSEVRCGKGKYEKRNSVYEKWERVREMGV